MTVDPSTAPYESPQHSGPYVPPTNTLAVISLIAAIFLPSVGLVLGVMAQRQIARTGESGAGLALAAIIVGSIFTGLFVLMFFAILGSILSVFASVFSVFAGVPR